MAAILVGSHEYIDDLLAPDIQERGGKLALKFK